MDVARDRRIRIYLGQPARGYLRFLVESLQPLAMLVGEDGQGGFVEARFGPEQPLFLEDRLDAWLSALDERGEALVLSTCGMGPWKPGWQGCYSGMRVGGFFVRPPWAPCRPELLDLVIDPGGGCGCGLHPTVQVCLGELEAAARPGLPVLDAGAGVGVLALAAARLGMQVSTLAAQAGTRQALRRNMAHNGLALQLLGSLDEASAPFPLVLANLDGAQGVLDHAGALHRLLAAGGTLILGGFGPGERDAVLALFPGLTLLREGSAANGAWIGLTLTSG